MVIVEMFNDLIGAEVRCDWSNMPNQALLQFFSPRFNFVIICANVCWNNDDDGLTNAERHYLVKMEPTPSKKISGWTVSGVEGANRAGGRDRSIVDGIGERCPIDNVVVNVPESLFLDLFAASRRA